MITAEQILQEMLTPLFDSDAVTTDTLVDNVTDFIYEFKQRVQAECQQLDGKRNFLMWHRKDGRETDGAFILLPQDDLALKTLDYYRGQCFEEGCNHEQIDGVERVIKRFEEWRKENSDSTKLPDLKPDDNAQ